MLLGIYRSVVWSASNRCYEVREDVASYYSKSLEYALEYLSGFAAESEKDDFSEKVSTLFETQWMILMIDSAMNKIHGYPDNGELYYDTLSKQYLTDINHTER